MYTPPAPAHYTGRLTPPGAPPDYWYQVIRMLDLAESPENWPAADFALLGYACEEGVRLNQGRLGAAAGPDKIREKIGRLANHLGKRTVADAGTVRHEDGPLEATQLAFGEGIRKLLERGITPIGLGGGHDIAYAHYLGIHQYLQRAGSGARVGILNFDAHFDLRPFTEGSTSGTPFRQILTFHGDRVSYLPVGIQEDANPPSLLRAAGGLGVDWISQSECGSGDQDDLLSLLTAWIKGVDFVYVTIDLDGFSSAFAPGVSAPSPVGFTPEFLFPVLEWVVTSGKLLSLDIAEMNPEFDRDGATATLAARIVALVTSVLP